MIKQVINHELKKQNAIIVSKKKQVLRQREKKSIINLFQQICIGKNIILAPKTL